MKVASTSPDTGQQGGAMLAWRQTPMRCRGRRRGLSHLLNLMNFVSTPVRAAVLGLLAPVSLCVSMSAMAQTATLKETVVTANRYEQPLIDLVADVSILDKDDIEKSGATGLADVLTRLPGFEMSRSGGIGGTTSLYIRGSETRFAAIYVDGVRVDSQATGGAPWESLPIGQVDRIEVLRGPASAVYGSDALGGVVQIFTKKGEGAFNPFVGFGYGTYGTQKIDAGFSGSNESIDYALTVSRAASTGFNSRPVSTQNPDDDGYLSESLSGRLGWQLNKQHKIDFTTLNNSLVSQYDSSTSFKDEKSYQLLQTKGLQLRSDWTDKYRTTVSFTESRVLYESKPSPYLTMTKLNGYLFHNEFHVGAQTFTAALEKKVDFLESTPIYQDRSQDALALGYGWRNSFQSVQVNVRHDQDSEFGGKDTGSLAYGQALNSDWRATASMGTAFRAPTLYQRFSAYGSPTLKPETALNKELGLKYQKGTAQFKAVAYQNQIDNLVTFSTAITGCQDPQFGCYGSTAQAEYYGVTLSGQERVGRVNLSGSFDIQNPRDLSTGKLLARRASHHAYFAADTRSGDTVWGAGVQLSGARYDDVANTNSLPGYTLINLYANHRLNKEWSLLARIDNLGDATYQLANTYASPGRQLYVAMRWAPGQ